MLFRYHAKSAQGELRTGELNVSSRSIAIDTLQRQGLVILSLHEVEQRNWWERFLGFGKPHAKDLVILSRQLSILFSADVPILASLKAVGEQTESLAVKRVMQDIFDDVSGGLPLSSALEKHSDVFGDFYVNLVRSGESAGRLSETFQHLADYVERSYTLITKTRNALIYPAFIIAVFIGVVMILLSVVMPKLNDIFIETGVELPIFTRIILAAGLFVSNNFLWIAIFILLSIGFLIYYLRTQHGRELWDHVQLKLPLIGGLFRKFYVARLADNFATLIVSGIPIIKSIELTADVVGNSIYRNILIQTAERIRGGGNVADSLAPFLEIPPLVVQMVHIGEQTGKLDFILDKVSTFYRREVENIVDNLVVLIEPVLIVILGAGVGFLVVGVLLPLYGLVNAF